MQKQHRFLSFVLVVPVLFALAQPIALMAQTEPTPTLAQAASTPDAAVSTPDPAAPPVPRVHVVVEGENLTTIAADYGVTVEDILAINNLANGDFLQLGQELIIPGGTGEAIATVYAIGAGDTLAEVAAIFNTTLADVVATNRVIATELPLIVGQTVPVVSRTGSATPRPATGRPYLVAAGDTLLTVAAAHKLTPAALAAANGLSGLTLFPGQRLRIPDETAVYRHLPEGWLDVRVSPTNPGQGSTVAVTVANLLPGTPAATSPWSASTPLPSRGCMIWRSAAATSAACGSRCACACR
jgi:LysM repeat protein